MTSYKEFESIVLEKFLKYVDISKDEAIEYIKTRDSQDVIEDAYESSIKDVKSGKLAESIFKGDVANSAAYCLMMLY